MSKTNSETIQSETETAAVLKLDVSVRPISPTGNLLGYANVKINDSFVVEGFRICSGEKGRYVNMPAMQDSKGVWHDTFKPITADARKQLTDAILDGYGVAIEKMQAMLDASRGVTEKPSVSDALKDNADKVKSQPVKSAGKADRVADV